MLQALVVVFINSDGNRSWTRSVPFSPYWRRASATWNLSCYQSYKFTGTMILDKWRKWL
jgi:hypothetical protein